MPVPSEDAWRRIVRSVLDSEGRNRSTPGTVKRPRGYPPGASAGTDIRLRANVNKPGGIGAPNSYDPFPVDNIEIITGGWNPQTTTMDDVHNDLRWEADDTALVYIERVDSLSTDQAAYYHAYQIECPPES